MVAKVTYTFVHLTKLATGSRPLLLNFVYTSMHLDQLAIGLLPCMLNP